MREEICLIGKSENISRRIKLRNQEHESSRRLLIYREIEEVYKLEFLLENSFKRLVKILGKSSESNANQLMNTLSSKSKSDHDLVQLGLLYKLLVDKESANISYRDISTSCRDNFTTIFKTLNTLVAEKIYKITPTVLKQILWFTNESLKNNLTGRDIVRLIVNVANVSGLNKIWTNIVTKPQALSPNFGGITALLAKPTSKHLVMTCLSQRLDQFINYLVQQITLIRKNNSRGEDYNFYFLWISRKNFPQHGEMSMVKPNIVRYLIINRTSDAEYTKDSVVEAKSLIVEWLLTTSQNNELETASLMLSLMFEFLIYVSDQDPRSNNSQYYPELSLTWKILSFINQRNEKMINQIVNFMPTLITYFIPTQKDLFSGNFKNAVNLCSKIIPIQAFNNFLESDEHSEKKKQHISSNNTTNENKVNQIEPPLVIKPQKPIPKVNENGKEEISNDKFDDTIELDQPLKTYALKANLKNNDWIDMTDNFNKIIDYISAPSFNSEKSNSILKNLSSHLQQPFQSIIDTFIINFDSDKYKLTQDLQDLKIIFKCPIFTFLKHMKLSDLDYINVWRLISLIHEKVKLLGFIVMFYDLFDEASKSTSKLTRSSRPKVHQNSDSDNKKVNLYMKYSVQWAKQTIEDSLHTDLLECGIASHKLFSFSIFSVYKTFGSKMVDESRFMQLVVGCLDADELKQLRFEVASNKICLIPQDEIVDLIDDSLNWETVEQIFFWQLLCAHNLPLNQVWQIISELVWDSHGEAINAVSSILKFTEPNINIMKCLFMRQLKNDLDEFVVLILDQWKQNFERQVLTTMQSYLNFLNTNSRIEFRNISLTLAQLASIYSFGLCSYIFDSVSVLKAIDNLKTTCQTMTDGQKSFLKRIEARLQQINA
ncbi:MAG: Integrator complex subunit 3 [Paramarteilia canceri]